MRPFMSYILHIDTSSYKGLVALARNGVPLAMQETLTARDHAASINVMLERVIADADIELKELDAVSVIGGPGSYTGLRIGLATAKGVCYALDKPLILTNKLTLLAQQASQITKGGYDLYCSALPARQKEYFFTLYRKDICINEPAHILEHNLQEVISALPGRTLLTGLIDPVTYRNISSPRIDYMENESVNLDYWCRRSKESYDCQEFVSLANVEPFYLKEVYTHKA